jgi:hypothetical protein
LVKKTAHPSIIIFIGVAQKALRLRCKGPSSHKKMVLAANKSNISGHEFKANVVLLSERPN